MKHIFETKVTTSYGETLGDAIVKGIARAAGFYGVEPSDPRLSHSGSTSQAVTPGSQTTITHFSVTYDDGLPGPKMTLKPSTLGESNEFPG